MIHQQTVISVMNIKMLYSQQLIWVCNRHMGYVDKGWTLIQYNTGQWNDQINYFLLLSWQTWTTSTLWLPMVPKWLTETTDLPSCGH